MADKNISKSAPKTPNAREERLKAALKANLGRRKTQTRARNTATNAAADDTQAKE
jgi:hypothetical protein